MAVVEGSVYAFQFQYGSIKRIVPIGASDQLARFQFQYGSIKRQATEMQSFGYHYFNSNMVRLKG